MKEELRVWAERFIGKTMRPWAHPELEAEVVSYDLGERGNGVWFLLANGQRVYRKKK
jgi:hypothetical protein